MKKVTGEYEVSLNVTCPYCGDYQDRIADFSCEELDENAQLVNDAPVELSCDSCGENFLVTEVEWI